MQPEMVWCIRVRNPIELRQCFGMVDWWRLARKNYRLEWARHSPRTRLVDPTKWLVKIFSINSITYLQIICQRLHQHVIQLCISLYYQVASHVQISAYLAFFYRMSGDSSDPNFRITSLGQH